MSDLESKIPEITAGIISLFAASPVLGAVVVVIVVGAIAALSIWYNGRKNEAAHQETEKKRQEDLTKLKEEAQRIDDQANAADDEIDSLRGKR